MLQDGMVQGRGTLLNSNWITEDSELLVGEQLILSDLRKLF